MVLRSEQFDDIYFSPEDGLAETRFVFLDGNNIPAAWQDKEQFVIAETGFGTGLNFLASWKLFEQAADGDQRLHYVSFEKYPLSRVEIQRALAEWEDELGERLELLLAQYPMRVPGFHRIDLTPQVSLTLVFDDVNEALPQLIAPLGVDAWFLDGFAPSKNPDMWTPLLFEQMARLSHKDTSFATFTAAGFVRRGLQDVGFAVEKVAGFGRKRERLVGVYEQEEELCVKASYIKRVAIIGGGLAGTSAAYVLKRRGFESVIYEAADSLASAASGNELGLFNPRVSAHRTAESDFYVAAVSQAVRTLKALKDIDLNICGNLHLITDEDRERRLKGVLENWGWHEDHLQQLDSKAASDIAGIDIPCGAVFLPDTGSVSPSALCQAYAEGVDVRLNHAVREWKPFNNGWIVDGEEYDAVILAHGAALEHYQDYLDYVPMGTVRGQVTKAGTIPVSQSLNVNLCYGGYMSAASDGHIIGSTFERDETDIDIRDSEHELNLSKLEEALPHLTGFKACGGRAGIRVATNDRSPLIGGVPDYQGWKEGQDRNIAGLYVSGAHGSHGIVSSLAAAYLIADMIEGAPYSLGKETLSHILPERYLRRARRRGKL